MHVNPETKEQIMERLKDNPEMDDLLPTLKCGVSN